jgi:arabinose-5-phosphate isomerase
LAVDALKIYEEHAIDDLLVVDRSGRLVGMVDIQDLPKFKIL